MVPQNNGLLLNRYILLLPHWASFPLYRFDWECSQRNRLLFPEIWRQEMGGYKPEQVSDRQLQVWRRRVNT